MSNPYMNTVSASSVLDVIDAIQCLSLIDDMSVLPDRNLFIDPESRVSEQVVIDLWHLLNEKSQVSCYGLLIGQHINPASKGLLAGLVSQCGSIKEAFDTFVKFLDWMNPSEHWKMEYDGDYVDLIFIMDHKRRYPAAAVERSMSALICWANFLNGKEIPITSASFEFEKPDYHELFGSTFGAKITFLADKNCIRFKQTFLQNTLSNYNPYLKNLLEEKLKKTFSEADISNNKHVSKVVINDLIIQLLPQHKATADVVCRYLSVSRQTLYRHLKKEGTDFKYLLNEARKTESIKLLAIAENSIQKVSEQLGYKEVSSFYHAFSRWYGTSVSQYRKSL